MKAILDKNLRKYYKYVDVEWTQPTLIGDNVYINNFLVTGSYAAYYPNTGWAGIYVDEGQGWITLYMRFNKPFVAKKFTFHTQTGWGAASGAYSITYSYSDDNQNWFTLGTSPDTPEGQTATIDMSDNNTPHQFYRLSVRNGGWAYEDALNIDNLHLYGNIREIVEGTADDYDFYTDVYQLPYKSNKKYYKYSTDSTLINPNGTITSATGGNGWIIYTKSANYGEVGHMLDTSRSPSYPRWQHSSPNVYAYIKTPQKCIITSYLTTQWCDDNETGRICNHWIIKGYETETDLLALINGTVIDDNTWGSRSKGQSKTITLNNTNAFKYYSIQMVSNFAGGSYCSMGSTKFYARLPYESSSADYDYYVDYKKYYAVKG